MITLLTGAPGSGKTAALVDLLRTVGKDRALYVYGLNGFSPPHIPLEDPHKWMESVPDGSAVVIDEVQAVWRPRGPGTKVPDHIAALETHRHRGLDFFLTTQGPRLLDSNVRALVGRHVHLRDLGVLGRWWYEWPECAENCATGFRSAPIKKRYRLPKHVFNDYKSASVHIKPIRSFPASLAVAVGALVVVAYLGWDFYDKLRTNVAGDNKPAALERPLSGLQARPSSPPLSDQYRSASAPPSPPPPVVAPEPSQAPPPPAFAGCASVRGLCYCFDVAGSMQPDDGTACLRASGLMQVPLQMAPPDTAPRPSRDDAADAALIRDFSPGRRVPFL